MRSRIFHIAAVLLMTVGLTGCFKDDNFDFTSSGEGSGASVTPSRTQSPDVRNVLLYVAAGFNDLSGWLAADIEDLESGPLPSRNSSTDPVLLVFSRLTDPPGSRSYEEPSSPVLFRMYADKDGTPVRDTLKVWSAETLMCEAETLTEAFSFMNNAFPGNRYGVIFSSHATGWLPPRYYENPTVFEPNGIAYSAPGNSLRRALGSVPEYFPPIDRNSFPAVKTIGRDDGTTILEMDLDVFAAAIPYHLDYLIFDACLMGCVEVAYELREKVDVIGFSPTEVLAEGFDYTKIIGQLLMKTPDPVAVCQDYFSYYDAQSGSSRSATITVIDTRKMEPLAEVCKDLFEKYRVQLSSMSGLQVQGFFRYNRHYYYDLKDVLVHAGITPEEETLLQRALDNCILYKAATPSFLLGSSGFYINTYSGLSMYLPSMGSDYLDKYYRVHCAWNRATQLVK
jgi:hypothetical protein